MSRIALIGLVACLAIVAAPQAGAGAGHRAFYLTVRPGQCLIAGSKSGTGSSKTVLVVPCPIHGTSSRSTQSDTAGGGTARCRRLRRSSESWRLSALPRINRSPGIRSRRAGAGTPSLPTRAPNKRGTSTS